MGHENFRFGTDFIALAPFPASHLIRLGVTEENSLPQQFEFFNGSVSQNPGLVEKSAMPDGMGGMDSLSRIIVFMSQDFASPAQIPFSVRIARRVNNSDMRAITPVITPPAQDVFKMVLEADSIMPYDFGNIAAEAVDVNDQLEMKIQWLDNTVAGDVTVNFRGFVFLVPGRIAHTAAPPRASIADRGII